ncbi:MAG: hypothetical protein US49_C0022G0001 [candidate division TM6 bacterium GW2011_GWF2_37_49]|nr:MAG: hypothetical protein US49_C0022G0001 [candidate division TM6 bacterium GW2011_GWF2_37_49]
MTLLNASLMYFVLSINSSYKGYKEAAVNQKNAYNFELKEWYIKSLSFSKSQLYVSEQYHQDLINLVGDSQKVIIRIPISACKSCIDECLKAIKRFEKTFIKNNFIFITSFRVTSDYELFIKDNGIEGLITKNIPIEELNINEKELLGLYFFKINTDLKISDIYFYSLATSFLLVDYFNIVFQ